MWCDVHELLSALTDDAVCVPAIEAEESLRKLARLELHRAEQKRLALAALKQGESEPLLQIPDSHTRVPGVDGLLRQLDHAAPTPFMEYGRPTNAELASGRRRRGSRPATSS